MLKHYLMNNQQYVIDDISGDNDDNAIEQMKNEENDNSLHNDDFPKGACKVENDLDSFMKDMEGGEDIPDPFNTGDNKNLELKDEKENPYLQTKESDIKNIVNNAKEQSKTWQSEDKIMNGGELFEGVTGWDDFDAYSSFESI